MYHIYSPVRYVICSVFIHKIAIKLKGIYYDWFFPIFHILLLSYFIQRISAFFRHIDFYTSNFSQNPLYGFVALKKHPNIVKVPLIIISCFLFNFIKICFCFHIRQVVFCTRPIHYLLWVF